MESKLYIDRRLDTSILTNLNRIEKQLNNGKIIIEPITSNNSNLLFKIIILDSIGTIRNQIAVKKYLNIHADRLHFISHTDNEKLLNYVIDIFSKMIAYRLNLECIEHDIGTYKHYYLKVADDSK